MQQTYSTIIYINPFSMPAFLHKKEVILYMLFFKSLTAHNNIKQALLLCRSLHCSLPPHMEKKNISENAPRRNISQV